MVQNRLLLIQSIFRENNLYAFWYLNRIITRELFFRNWSSRHRGVKSASDPKAANKITRLFGTVMPSSIPESTAWWRNQQKELFVRCKLMGPSHVKTKSQILESASDPRPEGPNPRPIHLPRVQIRVLSMS